MQIRLCIIQGSARIFPRSINRTIRSASLLTIPLYTLSSLLSRIHDGNETSIGVGQYDFEPEHNFTLVVLNIKISLIKYLDLIYLYLKSIWYSFYISDLQTGYIKITSISQGTFLWLVLALQVSLAKIFQALLAL